MLISGIADEAGSDIQTQIRAHQQLGWDAIELRLIDGKNVAGELDDATFDAAAGPLEEAGLTVTGFGSAIGNWSRSIDDDFDRDIADIKVSIRRMQRLGVKFIRTMSWVGKGVEESRWRDQAIERYRELARMAEDGGIYLAHENCAGWGGLGPEHTRRLIEAVDSDHLVVLFDVGNTVAYGQDPWNYYEGVKDLIRYVHIKDCKINPGGGAQQRIHVSRRGRRPGAAVSG